MEERAGREEEMAGPEKGIERERKMRRRRLRTEKNTSHEATETDWISLVGLLFHFAKSKITNYWRWTIFLLGI